MKIKFLLASCGLCFFSAWAQAAVIKPLSETCDGFAKLPLVTADNLCVGILAQRGPEIAFKMPRTAVETPDGKLLVADMGGWLGGKGKLWLVDFRKPSPTAKALLSGLNLPHKILRGRDGKYYLSEAHRIVRFQLNNQQIGQLETVIDGLPQGIEYLHPLKNFVFDNHNNLIVNIGSSSDHCNKAVSIENCVAGTEAALRLYSYQPATNSWNKDFEVLATGLRNSMALAVSKTGTIVQAENSIDLGTTAEPFEEINLIEPKGFYGWPLCYDRDTTVDSTRGDCSSENYHAPWALLPAHVAPMDALYYHNSKLPALNNKLLLTWHGYKVVGHRLVALEVDAQGRPVLDDAAVYMSDPLNAGDDFKTNAYPAANKGMMTQHSEVISHWNEVSGLRPKGSPVGMSVMNDGSLLVVDDKNAAILRVSNGTAYRDTSDELTLDTQVTAEAPVIPPPIHRILLQRCSKCHEQLGSAPEQLLNADHWLQKAHGKTRLEQKVFDDKTRPMPPDNSLLPREREQLRKWLKT